MAARIGEAVPLGSHRAAARQTCGDDLLELQCPVGWGGNQDIFIPHCHTNLHERSDREVVMGAGAQRACPTPEDRESAPRPVPE